MPARLIAWIEAARHWGPAVPVAIVFAVALVEAVVLPRRVWAKGVWVAVAILGGVLAEEAMHWQERARTAVTAEEHAAETAALRGLWDQLDGVSQSLPAAGDSPAASFDTVDDALASLSAKVAALQPQIAELREQSKRRAIDDATAAKLIDYLRQFGSFPVVVSCVPDDVEAYSYANQFASILRLAGWDAHGPETTLTRAEAAAMGVTVFVRDPHSPAAAKILIDAFSRFNVPYQTGLAASPSIPDTATVELFVAKKP